MSVTSRLNTTDRTDTTVSKIIYIHYYLSTHGSAGSQAVTRARRHV
jgi:hypothetical protein